MQFVSNNIFIKPDYKATLAYIKNSLHNIRRVSYYQEAKSETVLVFLMVQLKHILLNYCNSLPTRRKLFLFRK